MSSSLQTTAFLFLGPHSPHCPTQPSFSTWKSTFRSSTKPFSRIRSQISNLKSQIARPSLAKLLKLSDATPNFSLKNCDSTISFPSLSPQPLPLSHSQPFRRNLSDATVVNANKPTVAPPVGSKLSACWLQCLFKLSTSNDFLFVSGRTQARPNFTEVPAIVNVGFHTRHSSLAGEELSQAFPQRSRSGSRSSVIATADENPQRISARPVRRLQS